MPAYLAAQPPATRSVLRKVRSAIRSALPRSKELIAYQIPAYRIADCNVIYFAGWKRHYSLYPATPAVVARFKRELAGYTIAKGTIKFPLDEPVPAKLIAGIARLRAREVAAQVKAARAPKRGSRSR